PLSALVRILAYFSVAYPQPLSVHVRCRSLQSDVILWGVLRDKMGGGQFNALEQAHGAKGRDSVQARPNRRWRWPVAARRTQRLEEVGLPLHAPLQGARDGPRWPRKSGSCRRAQGGRAASLAARRPSRSA